MANSTFAKYWWTLVVRGVIALLFSLLALFFPGLTLGVLVLFFGAYALVDGIFAIGAAIKTAREHKTWYFLLLEGLIGIIVGVVTYFWPNITGLILLYLIAAWAILTGIFEILATFLVPWGTISKGLFGFSGFLSVLLGVLIIIFPVGGAIAVVWLIGAYALLFGIILIALGFQVRRLA